MAYHDISSRFWAFTAAAAPASLRPQTDCSGVPSHPEPGGTEAEAEPREPEWQGQWRVLKYV